jgi:type IV secretion system protein VirB4
VERFTTSGPSAVALRSARSSVLAHATVKRDYYYKSPVGRRIFSFGFGPVSLSFVGASGQDDLRTVQGLVGTHGTSWPAQWLRHRGLNDAAALWEGEVAR